MLDTRTLVIALVGICLLLSVAAFLAWRAHRHITALAYWAAGALAGACGLTLMALYGAWPAAFVVPLANALVASTYLLNWLGVRSFAGRPIPWRRGLTVLAAMTAGNLWFVVVDNDVTARIVIASAGYCGLLLLAALDLWRMAPADRFRQAQRRLRPGLLTGHTAQRQADITPPQRLAAERGAGQHGQRGLRVETLQALAEGPLEGAQRQVVEGHGPASLNSWSWASRSRSDGRWK